MPELDRAWSIQLKRAIGAHYKQCYKKAFTVVWRRGGELVEKWPDPKEAWYVEGVVVTEHDVGLSHAWVETAGGVILDPTLPSPIASHSPTSLGAATPVARYDDSLLGSTISAPSAMGMHWDRGRPTKPYMRRPSEQTQTRRHGRNMSDHHSVPGA
jgi:hypothetical protein